MIGILFSKLRCICQHRLWTWYCWQVYRMQCISHFLYAYCLDYAGEQPTFFSKWNFDDFTLTVCSDIHVLLDIYLVWKVCQVIIHKYSTGTATSKLACGNNDTWLRFLPLPILSIRFCFKRNFFRKAPTVPAGESHLVQRWIWCIN